MPLTNASKEQAPSERDKHYPALLMMAQQCILKNLIIIENDLYILRRPWILDSPKSHYLCTDFHPSE